MAGIARLLSFGSHETPAATNLGPVAMSVNAVMVARNKVEAALPEHLRRLLNGPVFADGLVSVERVIELSGKPAEIRVVMQLVATMAENLVARSDETREKLEGRLAQMRKDIDGLDKRCGANGWGRTTEAPLALTELAGRLKSVSELGQTVLAGFGADQPVWYSAWAGQAAAMQGAFDTLKAKVDRAQYAVTREPTFAADVANLNRRQLVALAHGLEECERLGYSFANGYGNSAPGATLLATLPVQPRCFLNVPGKIREEIKSLPDLVDTIERLTKLELKLLKAAPNA